MLMFYVIILLMIGAHIHGGVIQDGEGGKNLFYKKATIFLEERCVDHQEQLELVWEKLNDIEDCFDIMLPNLMEDDEEELQEKCFEGREELLKHVQQLTDLLEACLPPEEKYLPGYVLESFVGFSEYLCDHIHVLTMDGLQKTDMATCVNSFKRYDSPHYICFASAKFGNYSRDAPILQEELCEEMDSAYNCFERQFTEHCPDAPKAWEFQAGLLNGVLSPCRVEDEQEGEQDEEEEGEEKEEEMGENGEVDKEEEEKEEKRGEDGEVDEEEEEKEEKRGEDGEVEEEEKQEEEEEAEQEEDREDEEYDDKEEEYDDKEEEYDDKEEEYDDKEEDKNKKKDKNRKEYTWPYYHQIRV